MKNIKMGNSVFSIYEAISRTRLQRDCSIVHSRYQTVFNSINSVRYLTFIFYRTYL